MKASAHSHTYSLDQLPPMLEIARIAIALFNAEQDHKVARSEYHHRIHEYEKRHGQLAERLNPSNPRHAAVIAFSAKEYTEFAAAKRQVYNAKRRLEAAVRRLGAQA